MLLHLAPTHQDKTVRPGHPVHRHVEGVPGETETDELIALACLLYGGTDGFNVVLHHVEREDAVVLDQVDPPLAVLSVNRVQPRLGCRVAHVDRVPAISVYESTYLNTTLQYRE